jgi:hypothetical protein
MKLQYLPLLIGLVETCPVKSLDTHTALSAAEFSVGHKLAMADDLIYASVLACGSELMIDPQCGFCGVAKSTLLVQRGHHMSAKMLSPTSHQFPRFNSEMQLQLQVSVRNFLRRLLLHDAVFIFAGQ